MCGQYDLYVIYKQDFLFWFLQNNDMFGVHQTPHLPASKSLPQTETPTTT